MHVEERTPECMEGSCFSSERHLCLKGEQREVVLNLSLNHFLKSISNVLSPAVEVPEDMRQESKILVTFGRELSFRLVVERDELVVVIPLIDFFLMHQPSKKEGSKT